MAVSTVSLTTEQAIAKYKKYYDNYVKHDLVKVKQYRAAYKHIKGSLADQIVERAIWYMEHGYTVYGTGRNSYHSHGVVDCSEFTKLVFGDFGFQLTGAVKKYDRVGEKVEGVYPVEEDGSWRLEGVDHLRPGDICTWWRQRSDGSKFVNHVAIYMGQLNGKPAVIGTYGYGSPTALGIVTRFKNWWGKHFYTAQRVLPEGSWTPGYVIPGHEDRGPVIPQQYILPPQKPIVMPERPGR